MAIGKKKASLSAKKLTLEEKIKNLTLGLYLRGIHIFLNEYSKLFKTPNDIIDYWKKHRGNDEKIEILHKEVSDFPIWLKNQGYEDASCVTYQTHVRGFLSNNNIRLTFQNPKVNTIKKKQLNKLGITFNELSNFAEKVKEFLHDLDIQFLCEALHRTGLSWNEFGSMTFEVLRAKDYDKEDYTLMGAERGKTSIDYMNFISPALKDYVFAWLRLNKDKKDTDLLFGNNQSTAYQNLGQKFTKAYKKCCEAYFPRFLELKTKKGHLKKVFTLHTFRAIFKTACDNVGVINWRRDLLIAHKNPNMPNYDLFDDKDLLEDYKAVEKHLFGSKTSDQETITQVFDILKDLVANNGKRKALFRKYIEDESIDQSIELKGAIFIETLKEEILKSLQ